MNTRIAVKAALIAVALGGISACATDKKPETASAAPTADLLTQRLERAELAAMEAQRTAAEAQRTAEDAKMAAATAAAAAQANDERLNRAFERSQRK